MPVDSWRSRATFGSRPNYKRSLPIIASEQDYYKQQKNERLPCCYHYSQQSGQMNEDMNRRLRLGDEQKQIFDAKRICGDDTEQCPEFLKHQECLSEDVTLTMEVPNVDYPAIIGLLNVYQDDDSIPIVMQETGVRVLFPDVIPGAVNSGYVNQVKLIGPVEKVEEARKRIRKLSPVTIAFPLDSAHTHLSQEKVKKMMDDKLFELRLQFPKLKISVTTRPSFVGQFFREIYQNEIPICVVEGSMSHEADICEVCEVMSNLIPKIDDAEACINFFLQAIKHFCVSWLDIPLSQQLGVTGLPNGFLMRLVSLKSNATIFFPTPTERHVGATLFYFTGAAKATMLARKLIQALLPAVLSFDVEHSDLADPPNLPCIFVDEKLDVKVHIESAPESELFLRDSLVRDHVVIESTELNLMNVYKMRKQLVKSVKNDFFDLFSKDHSSIDEEFRSLVLENNKYIAQNGVLMPLRGTFTQMPAFDPKVPAPFCTAEGNRRFPAWREMGHPQQTWIVGGFQPNSSFSGPVYIPNGGQGWAPPLQQSSSYPSFTYPQYHSSSATLVSDDRSFLDSKTDHSQCSSSDTPTTAVQQLLDFFKPVKSFSNYKKHNPVKRSTHYV